MAIIFMMKIGNNNRNPSIHRKNVCVGITVLYMYKNVSSRPSYFVNERRCKGLLKKKEHHEYHYEYINLHIASFSVWLGSYAHKIAQRHIWQRSRHGFGWNWKQNKRGEWSFSEKLYFFAYSHVCIFFHKTHHGELRFTYCQFISVCFFSIFLVHAIFCQAFSECFHSGFAQNKDLLWHTNVFY